MTIHFGNLNSAKQSSFVVEALYYILHFFGIYLISSPQSDALFCKGCGNNLFYFIFFLIFSFIFVVVIFLYRLRVAYRLHLAQIHIVLTHHYTVDVQLDLH